MATLGWPYAASPFHEGERSIHARYGILERMDRQGRRIIRDHMPEQHRQFFAQLPYAIAGTIDGDGQPWASILVGEPGFMTAKGDRIEGSLPLGWSAPVVSPFLADFGPWAGEDTGWSPCSPFGGQSQA